MKKKALITSMALLLVAIVCLSTATYAWFASSSSVTAKGMKVTTTAGSYLLISNDAVATTDTYLYDFDEDSAANTLIPVTWQSNKFVTVADADAEKIDPKTGNVKTEYATNFSLTDVSGSEKSTGLYYYKDYTIHIATSAASALTNKNITCTITFGDPTTGISGNIMQATKVQILDSTGAYTGTTLTPGSPIANSTNTSAFSNVTIGKADGTGTNDFVCTLRVYLDGAQTKGGSGTDAAYAIVHSEGANIQDLGLKAVFTAS